MSAKTSRTNRRDSRLDALLSETTTLLMVLRYLRPGHLVDAQRWELFRVILLRALAHVNGDTDKADGFTAIGSATLEKLRPLLPDKVFNVLHRRWVGE
jgi:hypothetical protein